MGRRRAGRGWSGGRRLGCPDVVAEALRPVELTTGTRGDADSGGREIAVLDVRLVPGGAEPAVDDGLRRRVAVGDVLTPRVSREPAVLDPLVGGSRERRRVIVAEVCVAGHVERLPLRRRRQRGGDRELRQPQRGAVLVDQRDDLSGEVGAARTPGGGRGAVRDCLCVWGSSDCDGRDQYHDGKDETPAHAASEIGHGTTVSDRPHTRWGRRPARNARSSGRVIDPHEANECSGSRAVSRPRRSRTRGRRGSARRARRGRVPS